jgi:hypothetical protein
MCGRLDVENGVYSPSVIPVASDFKTLFMELYPSNAMWGAIISDGDRDRERSLNQHRGDKKKISVYARFSPKRVKPIIESIIAGNSHIDQSNVNEDQNKEDDIEVTLPLHQRLAMIKMSHNLKSSRQALKFLTSEGGSINCC